MSKKSKDPLLGYLFVASLMMSLFSVATWIGRPAPNIGMDTVAAIESERALASIEAESDPISRPTGEQTRWEVVRLTVSCGSSQPPKVPVGSHQHQVQLSLQDCPRPGESQLNLRQANLPTPLLVFTSGASERLDSEIIQLREGSNDFEVQWVTTDGQEGSRTFTIYRGEST